MEKEEENICSLSLLEGRNIEMETGVALTRRFLRFTLCIQKGEIDI